MHLTVMPPKVPCRNIGWCPSFWTPEPGSGGHCPGDGYVEGVQQRGLKESTCLLGYRTWAAQAWCVRKVTSEPEVQGAGWSWGPGLAKGWLGPTSWVRPVSSLECREPHRGIVLRGAGSATAHLRGLPWAPGRADTCPWMSRCVSVARLRVGPAGTETWAALPPTPRSGGQQGTEAGR